MPVIYKKSQFGLNLEAMMEKRGKSLNDLATKMGISRQRVAQLKYANRPSKENLTKLCRVLRCRKADLVGKAE